MKYGNTNLPENVRAFLEEIIDDEELCDAFYSSDVEIYDEDWVKDLEENFRQEFEELMGPGDSSYKNIKAFARDGTGALWVVLDDELIGYIGTEGQCGIVSRNINEFMNIIAALKGSSLLFDFWDVDTLKSEEAFIDAYNESEEDDETDYNEVFDKFINKHGFTHDLKTIYEYIVKGLTVQPFFQVIATDDDYVDSASVLGLDGQEQLEALMDALNS
ncbi:MAG: hypothetical protein IKF31_07395 [Clostridiales bacterium]|nr:hypothetical protein [Clostridiales bacterium]MBR4342896.1 hypothetical protein [Lachnospiraceae bacterium]